MLRTVGRTRRSQAATLFPGSEPIPKGSKPRQRLAVPDAVRGFLARDDVVDVADGEPFDVDAPRPSLGEALDTIGRVDDVHVKRPVLGRPRVRERVLIDGERAPSRHASWSAATESVPSVAGRVQAKYVIVIAKQWI